MIQARIIPQRVRGTATLVGSYKDRKSDKELNLLSSGKKVVNMLAEKDRVFQHTFEEGYPLTITLDEKDFQEKTVIDFWKNHPLVETEGYENPNLVSPQFTFEIKAERIRVEHEVLLDKLLTVSIMTGMDEQERRDLVFALGSDPRDMSSMEVFNYLIGLTLNGIGIAKRKEVKLFNQVKGIEKDASVYANKAIQYNIVNKEGSVYKISGRTLGTDVDSVISMIMSDSELYENYIKPEVDKYEKSIAEPEKLDIPEEIKELLPVESATRKRVARSVK
jgi:hypothetical protein